MRDRRLLTAIVCVSGQELVLQDESVLLVIARENIELNAIVVRQVPSLALAGGSLAGKPCSAERLRVNSAIEVGD